MKKTEDELLLYISRLESIIDHLPFELWYKDADGKYLIVNEKMAEYCGKEKEEILGRGDYDLYPEEAADFMVNSDRSVIEGSDPGFYEVSLGNDVFEDYKKPIFDGTGKLDGTMGISRNITQIKKKQQELVERERSKTLLLSNAPGVAFRCANDADYTVVFISDSCYDLTGYTAEELISLKPSYNDLIHPEYRRALIGKWDGEHGSDVISTDEYPITTKSGETKWVMEQSRRIYDADFNVVGAEGFITDVTQRRLAEDALKQSEERFRTVFEEAPLGMAIFDARTGETYQINTRYAEIVGRTKKELLAANIKDYAHPEEAEDVLQKINLINDNQMKSFSCYRRIIKPDGSSIWVNTTIAPLNSGDDLSNPRILCMIEDVDDRRRAEEEILYLSYYDQLTGLYNRRFYVEELHRIDTERNLPITLVMGDVNGLKLTNDAFGHLAGDRLLQHIADVIKRQCRADDIIARIGGDEFILLLPKTGYEQAEKLVSRVRAAIAEEDICYPVVCSVSFGWDTKKEASEDIGKIYINAEDHMYRHKLTESAAMRRDTIRLVLKTMFRNYKSDRSHGKRVSRLCTATAKALGMDPEEIRELRLAGLMQNIGYIGLREEVLRTSDRFTEAERTEMERHPEIGYQLLRSVGKYSSIAEYVLYHHERIDGKGYPSKARADAIPVQSKILAIADAFDAMISGGGYRNKMTVEEAAAEVRRNIGSQFDKEIGEVFLNKVLRKEYGYRNGLPKEGATAGIHFGNRIKSGLHVGIDGCKGKWITVAITGDRFEVGKFSTVEEICAKYRDAETMLIDIPIGLPESLADFRPDKILRKQLGKKGSSIFETPCRQAVYAASKELAREWNKKTLGRSLSEQSLGIIKAIRQTDEFLHDHGEWKNRLLESHPEYCFMILNHGEPVLEKKTEEAGQARRLTLLRRHYSFADRILETYLREVPARKKLDDVIDALCLAVVGKLSAEYGLETVPENPMADPRGILMQVVCSGTPENMI